MTSKKEVVELRMRLWLARVNKVEYDLENARNEAREAALKVSSLEAERERLYEALESAKKELDAEGRNMKVC